MSRVKRGVTARARHKKVLKMAKQWLKTQLVELREGNRWESLDCLENARGYAHFELEFDAIPQGLNTYNWIILENGITSYVSSAEGDELRYLFNRTAVDVNVEVQLSVENFAGCESSLESTSFVIPAERNINAGFSVNPVNQTLPNATINITNTTSPGPWSYEWDFGDGNVSSDANLSEYTYSQYGTYTVSLTVSDGICEERVVRTITINPIPPIVDFEYDPASGCAPLTVNFFNLS